MARLVTLSRAAKLAGVSRGNLQKYIRDGAIQSFEGMVRLEDIARHFPALNARPNDILETLQLIMDNAAIKARNRTPSMPPDMETLAARVGILSDELVESKLEISIFYNIIDKLKSRLKQFAANHPDSTADMRKLQGWLLSEVETIADKKFEQYPLVATDTILRIVAAQVRLDPSGHEFLVEGSDSILEAGLSSGLALNYGCSNGNCGKCKARIISGKVKKIRHHDYVLTEKDKLQGYILCCSNTAVTDLVLQAEEAGNENDIPQQSITAWVRKITPLNDSIATLNIKTPRTQRLRFLAGQTVSLEIAGIGSKIFHIASCPCDDMNLQIHFNRQANDAFSQYLARDLKPNDTLNVEGPAGHFVLHEDEPNPIIYIAFNSGFAPIKSLIEHALTLDVTEHIQLYWLVPEHDDLYMHNHCRSWADAFEYLDYFPLCYATNDPVKTCIDELNKSNSTTGAMTNHHIYIAGSDEEITQTRNALLKQGIAEKSIFTELVQSI